MVKIFICNSMLDNIGKVLFYLFFLYVPISPFLMRERRDVIYIIDIKLEVKDISLLLVSRQTNQSRTRIFSCTFYG